ncbi:MAG: uroporphyrinogen-III C-methyltransferase, partial [Brachybacterium tyrofermentans]
TRHPAGQAMAPHLRRLPAPRLRREGGVVSTAPPPPSVAAAVDDRRAAGATRVAVATYLLAPGQFHSQLEGSGADLVAAPLGDHPLIAEIAVDRYRTMLGA